MREHLAGLVEDFRRWGGATAVVAHRGNRRYRTTYGELAEIAGRFSAELERRGVDAGERVVLWGENSAEWVGVFFGCLLRGVVVVPLDAAGSDEFAVRVVKDVAPRLVVGDLRLTEELQSSGVERVSFAELMERMSAEPLFEVSGAVRGDSPFQIVFTSGTTSEPKGIVHTHRNVLASLGPIESEIARYRRYERWVHPLRFLHTLPLSHVFGQFMGLWVPPVLGAEVNFTDQHDPGRMVEALRSEKINLLVAVPRVAEILRRHLLVRFDGLAEELAAGKGEKVWARWWRFRRVHGALGWRFWAVISGGASLGVELEEFWNGLGLAVIQGYGMTETAALVTLNHPFRIGRGTIGKALPGREVRISDEGEILVRGEMLSGAVWQNGGMRAREGEWLATGDLAVKEESGELRFVGRKGDVIVTAAGMNVHPADLEGALKAQAGVKGCVVVGCEAVGGEEPVAAVIFAGSEEQLQEAVGEANRGLAEFQRIRRVVRWEEAEFPYTSTGKLLRRRVAEWVCAAIAGRKVTGGAGGDALLRMIAEITGEQASGGDGLRLSEDLHLDSLGRVQLQSMLEQRWGVELEDDAVAGVGTVGELRALVGGVSDDLVSGGVVEEDSSLTGANNPRPKVRMWGTRIVGGSAGVGGEDQIYPRWAWRWPVRMLRVGFVEGVVRPLVWLLAAPKVTCVGTLPRGPVLVIANHVTAYDGALVLYALPGPLRRRMAIAMSGELLMDLRKGRGQGSGVRNLFRPVGYWLVTALFHVFPLPRLRGFRRSFAYAGEAMDRGDSVMIFPEGTRSRNGVMQGFRPGIGLLAQASGVPVVPVKLVGLGEMKQGRAGWFRSGRLEIRVGEAVIVNGTEDAGEIAARLEESVRRLG